MAEPSFHRIEQLFHEAIALEPQQRPAFLDRVCAGDSELHSAVEELLYHDRLNDPHRDYLASPVAQAAAELRQDPPTLRDPDRLQNTYDGQASLRIPGYELLEELGRGGMGVVYKARQTSLNRIVALKMLLPASPLEEETLARFRTEAESLARLHHPNIVPIYDIGSFEGRPFFTMEYVAGPSLALVLEGRPQDARTSASLIEKLARAIHDLHQGGIIHRDLKPANILLEPLGKQPLSGLPTSTSPFAPLDQYHPKITDFGLAKDQNIARNLTQTGTTMGTPLYMAPEQARSKGVDVGPPADIYSLGSILYEMLTGRPPFDAATPAETLAALQNVDPVSPTKLQPKVPRDLATICLRCLEKSPRRRYASAQALAEDLDRFLAGKPIQARPVGPIERTYRWCLRRPLVASLIALSCLLATSVFATALVYNRRLEDSNNKLEQALADLAAKSKEQHKQIIELNLNIGLTNLEDDDALAALLRIAEALRLEDGKYDHAKTDRTLIAAILRQSPHLERVINLDKKILCLASEIANPTVATIKGANVIELTEVFSPELIGAPLITPLSPVQGSCSSNGRWFAALNDKGNIVISGLKSGMPITFDERDRYTRVAFHIGRPLLITLNEKNHVKVWDFSGNKLQIAREYGDENVQFAAISSDGHWSLTIGKSRAMALWETETGKTAAWPRKVESDIQTFAVSPDGQRLALFCADNYMTLAEVSTGQAIHGPIKMHDKVDFAIFSPDGERLLAGSLSGAFQVWNMATGQPETPPVCHLGHLAGAAFTKDQKQIITASKNGMVCLWSLPEVVPAHQVASAEDMNSLHEIKTATEQSDFELENGFTVRVKKRTIEGIMASPSPEGKQVEQAVFSPDGQRVAVAENETTVRIWEVSTGKPLTPPLHHKRAVHCAAFSPDGKRLLTATSGGTARVWDAQSGEIMTPPLRYGKSIDRVFFSSNGQYALLLHEGNKATAWDLTPDQHSVDDLLALAQIHSGSQINDKQEVVSLNSAKLHSMWKKMQDQAK